MSRVPPASSVGRGGAGPWTSPPPRPSSPRSPGAGNPPRRGARTPTARPGAARPAPSRGRSPPRAPRLLPGFSNGVRSSVVIDPRRPPPARPPLRKRDVDGQRVEPRRERALAAERAQPLPGPHEDVLGQLLRQRGVPRHPHAEGVDAPHVPPVQLLESGHVPRLGTGPRAARSSARRSSSVASGMTPPKGAAGSLQTAVLKPQMRCRRPAAGLKAAFGPPKSGMSLAVKGCHDTAGPVLFI